LKIFLPQKIAAQLLFSKIKKITLKTKIFKKTINKKTPYNTRENRHLNIMAFKINPKFSQNSSNIAPLSNTSSGKISAILSSNETMKTTQKISKEPFVIFSQSESSNSKNLSPSVFPRSTPTHTTSPKPASESTPSPRTSATPRTSPESTSSTPSPDPMSELTLSSPSPEPINRIEIVRTNREFSPLQKNLVQTKILLKNFKGMFSLSKISENEDSSPVLSDSTSSSLSESDLDPLSSTTRDYVQSSLENPEKDLEKLLETTYPNKGNLSDLATLRKEIQKLSTKVYIENIAKAYQSNKSRVSRKTKTLAQRTSSPLPCLPEEEKASELCNGSLKRTSSFSKGLGDLVKLVLSNPNDSSQKNL
jgi:hypothetical protein